MTGHDDHETVKIIIHDDEKTKNNRTNEEDPENLNQEEQQVDENQQIITNGEGLENPNQEEHQVDENQQITVNEEEGQENPNQEETLDENEQIDTNEESPKNLNQEQVDGNMSIVEYKNPKQWALLELRCRLEDAILGNYLYGKSKSHVRGNVKENKQYLKDLSLWGVPLLPSKGHQGTDTILLKFLKARDFKTLDAFEMLRRTLVWRSDHKIDKILDEKLCDELENTMFFDGCDKDGHPIFYNKVYGSFRNKELYRKTFGTDESRDEFLRWRVQFMERGVEKGVINFNPGGVNTIIQITDLRNTPRPSCSKELQSFTRKSLALLHENYPCFILRNIIVNVPLWHYTYHHMFFSRTVNQRNRNKLVFARPSTVTKTLLKYIRPENIPIQYGGLKRENDDDFSTSDIASEFLLKKGFTQYIKIPIDKGGLTVVWDVTVVGWDVTYKEEFIPDDEGSYMILLQKEKQLRESARNSFYINEPGKIVITITNNTLNRNKRVFYRYKTKPTVPVYILFK